MSRLIKVILLTVVSYIMALPSAYCFGLIHSHSRTHNYHISKHQSANHYSIRDCCSDAHKEHSHKTVYKFCESPNKKSEHIQRIDLELLNCFDIFKDLIETQLHTSNYIDIKKLHNNYTCKTYLKIIFNTSVIIV